ncbi:hypothetical protein KJ611_04650 [Patescibacteria group bacterium]|nr:hypothetical protein [Patescibacteria group bacterium]
MSIFDLALIICIVIAAGGLLYRSLRRQWTCSGCAGCSCGHAKPAVKFDDLNKE